MCYSSEPYTDEPQAMELKDIKAIIDLMKKNSLSEFELERQDFKIKLKRGVTGGGMSPADDPDFAGYTLPRNSVSAGALPPVSAQTPSHSEVEIKSPMIGTFYRTPAPEAAPYIDVGSEVGSDSVACIIEAMKVMNEIKAEVRGVVTAILAENGKPVEFGQPLFRVRLP